MPCGRATSAKTAGWSANDVVESYAPIHATSLRECAVRIPVPTPHSCHAQQLRTISFAKTTQAGLLWVTAHDELQKNGGGRRQASVEERKERWLGFHDRHTSKIPGLLPFVLDVPVRFTQAPNVEAKTARRLHEQAGLATWLGATPPKRKPVLAATKGPKVVLNRRPTMLLIEPENSSKELPRMNGKRIYTLNTQAKP